VDCTRPVAPYDTRSLTRVGGRGVDTVPAGIAPIDQINRERIPRRFGDQAARGTSIRNE